MVLWDRAVGGVRFLSIHDMELAALLLSFKYAWLDFAKCVGRGDL